MFEHNLRDTPFAPRDPQIIGRNQKSITIGLIGGGVAVSSYLLSLILTLAFGTPNVAATLRINALFLIFLFNSWAYFYNSYRPWRYWRRLQEKRQLAFARSESYLASDQPAPALQAPQPVNAAARIYTSELLIALSYTFFYTTTIAFLFSAPSLLIALQIGVAATLLVGILLFVMTYRWRNKRSWDSKEVSEAAITIRIGKVRDSMPWQEVCFFSTYRGPRNLFDFTPNRYSRYYEVASPYRIIRWRHRPRIDSQVPTQPEMDQQAYDRWHQQLLGYIRERTGLPLVDLDSVPAPNKPEKTKRQSPHEMPPQNATPS